MSISSPTPRESGGAHSIAVIGAGPRGVGFLERLAANLDDLWGEHPLVVHLVDPFPPGPGRIWRYDQSPLLKLNSMAEDVTMFTDESSTIEGPVRPGPSLGEWVADVRSGAVDVTLVDNALEAEVQQLTGTSFPTRRLQSLYLDWFYRQAVAALGDTVRVEVHPAAAVRVDETGTGTQVVVLGDGISLAVDLVLYSVGHNGAEPAPEHAGLADFAGRHGLYYLPPAFTADADTAAILPGQSVIVRGFGLAAVDLTVLLTEGRGGRFTRHPNGKLEYSASGREPRLFIGSRRGVPYHSKISSSLVGDPPLPRFFTPEIAAELERARTSIDFAADVWPLIAQDMLWGYYRELFTGHPERVSGTWADFSEGFAAIDPRALLVATARAALAGTGVGTGTDDPVIEHDARLFRALVDETVADPIDRVFLPDFDRPLAGSSFESPAQLQRALREYIRRDLTLRTGPEHSGTLGLFLALLNGLFTLSNIVDSPKWSARSRVRDIHGWWLGYFSYVASGPPGHRLEEILALSEAGIVEFLGSDVWVEADESAGVFRAGGANVDRVVTATALVEARLPATSIARSDNELLRSLVITGSGVEHVVTDDGFAATTGLLAVRQKDKRIIGSSGEHHARRYAIGPYTNSPFVGAFSRPRTNAISFRENDKVARAVLCRLTAIANSPEEETMSLDHNAPRSLRTALGAAVVALAAVMLSGCGAVTMIGWAWRRFGRTWTEYFVVGPHVFDEMALSIAPQEYVRLVGACGREG